MIIPQTPQKAPIHTATRIMGCSTNPNLMTPTLSPDAIMAVLHITLTVAGIPSSENARRNGIVADHSCPKTRSTNCSASMLNPTIEGATKKMSVLSVSKKSLPMLSFSELIALILGKRTLVTTVVTVFTGNVMKE